LKQAAEASLAQTTVPPQMEHDHARSIRIVVAKLAAGYISRNA
jgi:hypothetical protein